jgi:hypothetical protein
MLTGSFAQIRAGMDAGTAHLAPIALDPLAIERMEVLLQEDRQLARAVKRVRGVQFVEEVLDGHLLLRWWQRLILQAAPADAEQSGLGCQWQGLWGVVDQGSPLGMAQDGTLFFRNLTWVVSRPISAYSCSSCWAWAA